MEEEKKNDCEVFADLPIFAAPRQNEKRQTQKRKGSDFIASVVDRCTMRTACKSMNGHPEQIAL